MLGLNIAERRDGDRMAISLSPARCRLDCGGESRTGDGERLKPKLGESGCVSTSINGELAERGETTLCEACTGALPAAGDSTERTNGERGGEGLLSVGLRAKSDSA